MELLSLTIEILIVHEIPRHKGEEAAGPIFSDVESPMDDEVRNFFEERLRQALNHSAFPGVFLEDSDSCVPKIIRDQIGAFPSNFVDASKKIAQRLFDVQPGSASPGLLTVMRCSFKPNKVGLAILKLEKEHGLRVSSDTHKGKNTFSLEHIKNLMLTEKTRVFKSGLFRHISKAETEISLVDQQRPPSQAIARFFLTKFLGCALAEASDVLTKAFMEATESWINEEVTNSATKSKYQVALMAELGSNRTTVTPKTFAEEHLDLRDRSNYIAALEKRGASTRRFPKDSKLVRNRLRRVQYDFKNHTTVLCPPKAIGETVQVRDDEDGQTKIEISGHLKTMKGRGK